MKASGIIIYRLFKLSLFVFLSLPVASWAANYNLSSGNYPPCSTGNWSVSGTTYTCTSGTITLSSGDNVTANAASTLVGDSGLNITGSTIGNNGNNISLQSNSTVIIAGSTIVYGNVSAPNSTATISDTEIKGNLTISGTVNLTNGSVDGLVTSTNSTVTTNGTDIAGGISASGAINLTGGTIAGSIATPNSTISLTGVTMPNGTIGASGRVDLINSNIGSAGSSVIITAANSSINVDSSTVYGDLIAPVWSTVNVINGGVVIGTCIPGSTPADACSAASPPVNLIANWQLDEATWAGFNDEVEDISGEDLHGRAIRIGNFPATQSANPALSGNPGTCRYGSFSSSDGYVLINDDPRLDLTEFTVTAWVNPQAFPSGNGLGTIISKDENFEFHVRSNGRVFWWWQTSNGTQSITTTNTRLSLNTWHHLAITYENGSQVLYIDGVSAGTLSSTNTISNNNDGVIIGTDHNGLINSRRFNGFIDEVRIYDGPLSAPEINTIRAERHTCDEILTVDHYGISHSGTGVTCEAEPVVITAYDSSNNPIAPPANTTVTLTTSTNTGVWVGGNTYTFTGSETDFTAYLQHTTPGTINVNVTDGAITEDASLDPSLVFNNTGIKFYDAMGGLLQNQVAGVPYNNAVLRAIKTDDETGACVARVQGSTNVGLAYECRNPDACINTEDFLINGEEIARNDNGAGITYINVPLVFDNGEAPIDLEYSDVGQLRLHGRLVIPASGNDPAVTLTTTSNEFVVKPYSIVVTEVTDAGNGTNPGATNIADCNNIAGAQAGNFVKAGDVFTAKVESQNADGDVTPNFGNETVSESVRVQLETLVYPSGGNPGVLSNPTGFTKTAPGVFTNTDLRWSEVGAMTLLAEIATDNNYLGAGAAETQTESNTIGRFYPHEYLLTTSTVVPACGVFSYMSQAEMTVTYTLAAHKLNGGLLTNYDAGLGFSCTAPINYVAENNDDGVNMGSRVLVEPVTSNAVAWSGGLWNVSDTAAAFLRATDSSIDGPFADLAFGVSVLDSVFSATLQNTDMNATTTGDCSAGATCDAVQLGTAQDLRFGRLLLSDAYGPESLDLPVEFITQYHNGTRWQKSTTDSCSKFLRNTITYPTGTIDMDANRNVGIGAARGEYGSIDPVYVNMVNGDANHYFSASGASTGTFPVTIDLMGMTWLQFDWDANGTLDTSVTGRYQFGSYRGHDRILYWREDFQ